MEELFLLKFSVSGVRRHSLQPEEVIKPESSRGSGKGGLIFSGGSWCN